MAQRKKNRFHRRDRNHDYFSPFIYHIILEKNEGCERFGEVKGDARIAPGNAGCAEIAQSPLGKIIAREVHNFRNEYPLVKILQYKVMPDHVHILMQVLERSEYHLGDYIRFLKTHIFQKYRTRIGKELEPGYIFTDGYCDKPLYRRHSLQGLFKYIRENPHRLAMRIQYPNFFQRKRGGKIGEATYEMYGNLFLLRNPDKMQVQTHRRWSPKENEDYMAHCLECAMKGTVMVSPFIAEWEKKIRDATEEVGALQILIICDEFGERYKPGGKLFDLCSEGRLLIISMGKPIKPKPSREDCNEMNALAKLLAGGAG